MLSKLSIRSKIVSVVVLLLVMMGSMGALSVGQMREINFAAHDIETNWMASIQALSDIHAGVLRYRLLVRDYLLTSSEEEQSKIEAALSSLEARNVNLRKAYEPLITSNEEQGLYDRFKQSWSSYVGLSREMIGAARARDVNKAQNIFATTMGVYGTEADSVLEQDFQLNSAGAKEAGRKATRNYSLGLIAVLGITGFSLVVGVVLSFLLVRSVSSGISSVVSPMEALGRGELQVEIPSHSASMEIGVIANALHVFKSALVAKKAADDEAAAEAEAKIRRATRVDAITKKFETVVAELVSSLSSSSVQLEAAASTLTQTAEVTGRTAGTVASNSQEVSSNVQSVAIAAEEITSSAGEISRQVQEATRVAQRAVQEAHKTDSNIAHLSQAASRIGDVVKLITAIAEQTNLLALNATIEAARAGEAGRGFAVVASEVKALASQTAKATEEITGQISNMQSATQQSVIAIKEISSTIGQISEISASIAASMEEQGTATHEIARNVQFAAQRSESVSQNISDVSRGASETGAASEQVLSSAQVLSKDSRRLKSELDRFLSSVRAA